MQTRRYQQRAVAAFSQWFDTTERIATIILPTGTGKSYTMSLCVGTLPKEKKVLWVAHREELIHQAVEALRKVEDFSLSIEMAEEKASKDSQIIVSTVQTFSKGRKHLEGWVPDLIIIDEYHHFAEGNVQYSSLTKRFPGAKVLGATATPYRMSGEELPLGKVLIEMDVGLAIQHGYLVHPTVKVLKTKTSLAEVKTKMGDFAVKDLSLTVNNEQRNLLIRDNVIELVQQGRKGVVFAVDVEHSKEICRLLSPHVRVAEIYGETPKEERREAIRKISRGEVDVVTNNLCLTEGFDSPMLSFCCMARPTRSLSLYTQCIGRVLRLFEGKEDAIILDLHDLVKVKQSRVTFFDFANSGDLSGEGRKNDAIIKAKVDINPAKYIKNLPIFLRSPQQNRWMVDDETFHFGSWMIQKGQWITTWSVKSGATYRDKLFFICLSGKKDEGRVLGFERYGGELRLQIDRIDSKKECERIVLEQVKNDQIYQLVKSGAAWKENSASDRQKDFVESMVRSGKIGFDIDTKDLTKGEASAIIEQAKWQEIITKKFGCEVKEALITFNQEDEDI